MGSAFFTITPGVHLLFPWQDPPQMDAEMDDTVGFAGDNVEVILSDNEGSDAAALLAQIAKTQEHRRSVTARPRPGGGTEIEAPKRAPFEYQLQDEDSPRPPSGARPRTAPSQAATTPSAVVATQWVDPKIEAWANTLRTHDEHVRKLITTGSYREAEAYIHRERAKATDAFGHSSLQEASLYILLGNLLREENTEESLERALVAYRQAYRIKEGQYRSDRHEALFDVYGNLSLNFFQKNDVGMADQALDQAYALAVRTTNPDVLWLLQLFVATFTEQALARRDVFYFTKWAARDAQLFRKTRGDDQVETAQYYVDTAHRYEEIGNGQSPYYTHMGLALNVLEKVGEQDPAASLPLLAQINREVARKNPRLLIRGISLAYEQTVALHGQETAESITLLEVLATHYRQTNDRGRLIATLKELRLAYLNTRGDYDEKYRAVLRELIHILPEVSRSAEARTLQQELDDFECLQDQGIIIVDGVRLDLSFTRGNFVGDES